MVSSTFSALLGQLKTMLFGKLNTVFPPTDFFFREANKCLLGQKRERIGVEKAQAGSTGGDGDRENQGEKAREKEG